LDVFVLTGFTKDSKNDRVAVVQHAAMIGEMEDFSYFCKKKQLFSSLVTFLPPPPKKKCFFVFLPTRKNSTPKFNPPYLLKQKEKCFCVLL
jgi:hypothetical protein